jgi:hypothetical protein
MDKAKMGEIALKILMDEMGTVAAKDLVRVAQQKAERQGKVSSAEADFFAKSVAKLALGIKD